MIRPLFRAAQICTEAGRVPRIHDFRHAFAIEPLLRWYRTGANVQEDMLLMPRQLRGKYNRYGWTANGPVAVKFQARCGYSCRSALIGLMRDA